MAYQEPYAGAMAAQNKKKKKQPSMAQAQGAGAQQPQTYGQPSMAQAQGQGQDPLVSAIAAGSQGQNQQPSMAQAQGGIQPEQQQPTMQQAQGGATPPPPPPPPPVQQNMPGTVQGGNTQVQQNIPGSVQGTPQVQQNIPGSVQGTPQVQQNMAGTVQGGMTGPQQTMPQAQSLLAGMDLSSQLQQGPPQLLEDEFRRRALKSGNQFMSPEQQEQMVLARMPQAEKQAAIQDLQRALQNPLHEDKDEIRRQLKMFGGQEAPAGSFDFSQQTLELNQALAQPNWSPEDRAEIRRQLALMTQAQQPVAQPSMADAQAPAVPVQQNLPGSVQGTPQVQQNMAGTVQGAPQVQQNLPGSVQGTPQGQQNMPGAVQGTPQVQQNMAGSVQGTPQVQQNMAGTVQGDDLTTALRDDINRQYTEGMAPAVSQRDQINQMYEEGMGVTDQRDDINRQYQEAFGGAPVQTQQPSMAEAQAPSIPADIAGAGADMAAAQNVVTPEAAPMPDTLEEALRQQYMSRVGGTDDPILASQLADQQLRQNEARKAMVEQLGRYGVLRGGGDTAAALARMGEGDERNRLALEAQAAQRRQQDLRDAQGFDIGQRGMGLQEDRAQQDTLTQALNRDIARAGQTGIFERGETMASRKQAAELDALRRREERADAGLTGQFGGEQTLQAQRQEADIFGEVDGRQTLQSDIQRGTLGLGERKTGLAERTGAEDIRRSTAQRGAIEGQEGRAERQLDSQLFGEVDGRQTLTGETTRSGLDTQDLQRRIAEAGQTGRFDFGDQRGTTQTQQARALESELDTAALGRDATRAGMTGQFEGEDTLENRLRTAAMTGTIGEGEDAQTTLAGRQAEQDLIGSILAGVDIDDPRLDPLLQSLTDRLGEGDLFTEENRQAFEDRLGVGGVPELPEFPLASGDKKRFEELQRSLEKFDKLPEKDRQRFAGDRQEVVEKMREISDPNNSPYIQDLLRKETEGLPLQPQERRRLMEARNRLR